MDRGRRKGIAFEDKARTSLNGLCSGGSDSARVLAELLIDGIAQPARRAGPRGNVDLLNITDENGDPVVVALGVKTLAALVRPYSGAELGKLRFRLKGSDPRGAIRGPVLADWWDEASGMVDAYNALVTDVLDITGSEFEQSLKSFYQNE